MIKTIKENWLRPLLFYGHNHLSRIGAGITTASIVIWWTYWILNQVGHAYTNPYLSLIFFFFLPIIFIVGLAMVALGVYLRRRKLRKAGKIPEVYPKVDLNSSTIRHTVIIVSLATMANLLIVGIFTYKGVSYMDTAGFCGTSCHVMRPQWVAYQHSPHSHVACVDCHIGSGAIPYVKAKMQGTQQVFETILHDYPRPITASLNKMRPASATCEHCHNPTRFPTDKLMILNRFENDKKNTELTTILTFHLYRIHKAHHQHIVYTATNNTDRKIISVSIPNGKGGITKFVNQSWKGSTKGVTRVMDCMDCHNQPGHTFLTPEKAIDQAMEQGSPSTSLPYVHKEGLSLIQAKYSSQAEAGQKIKQGLDDYYKTKYPKVWENDRSTIRQAAQSLVAVYDQNVFPSMKVNWGTYPTHIAMSPPGCFRCHNGDFVAKDGQKIPNGCNVCHSVVAMDETNPKILDKLNLARNQRPGI